MQDQPHIYLHCVNCVSAAGVTLEATKEALFSDKPKALTVYPGLLGESAFSCRSGVSSVQLKTPSKMR